MEERRLSPWWLYIIECGDGSLYTGVATDVARRFAEHEARGKKAARYTKSRGVVRVVYQKEIGDRREALKEELRVKSLSRVQKLHLVQADASPHNEDSVSK